MNDDKISNGVLTLPNGLKIGQSKSNNTVIGSSTITSKPSVSDNILRNYVSYSPIISFMVGSRATYDTLMDTQKWDKAAWYLICKSGGKGNVSNGFFTPDLFLDDLEINTICGLSSETRGSNATDVKFTITEPYGMDFIENLFALCHTETPDGLGEDNYLQIPYLLHIYFEGIKEDGAIEKIPSSDKIIPIHLVNIEVKLSSMGSIYKVEAVAYNEIVLTEKFGRIPVTFELDGVYSGTTVLATPAGITGVYDTLAEIGSAYGNDVAAGYNAITGKKTTPTKTNSPYDTTNKISDEIPQDSSSVANATTIGGLMQSLCFALNNYQHELETLIPGYVGDHYYYNMVGDGTANHTTNMIKDATISGDADVKMADPISTNNQFDVSKAANWISHYAADSEGMTKGGVEYGYRKITLSQGSSIVDSISTMIINSTYITDQIDVYNATLDEIAVASQFSEESGQGPNDLIDKITNTPLYWFIITPIVRNKQYDNIRRTYASYITYEIRPYLVYNSSSVSISNGNPGERVVKEYDYIFSGKNTEILNFDIDFQSSFMTYGSPTGDVKGHGTGAKMPEKTAPPAPLPLKKTPINQGNSVRYNISSSTNNQPGIGSVAPAMVLAGDVASTIYTLSDLLQLNLTIMGDPDYIKQDGIFMNSSSTSPITMGDTRPKYFNYNSGEIYVNIGFKTPKDINASTGIMQTVYQKDTVAYSQSVFSGLYRIVSVTNKFSKGQFTQQLEMYRFNDSHDFDFAPAQQQYNEAVSNALSAPGVGIIDKNLPTHIPPTPSLYTGDDGVKFLR